MVNESKKPVNTPAVGADYRYIPQVYAARVVTGTREPCIAPEEFGSERLAGVYLCGFASICKNIVLW